MNTKPLAPIDFTGVVLLLVGLLVLAVTVLGTALTAQEAGAASSVQAETMSAVSPLAAMSATGGGGNR